MQTPPAASTPGSTATAPAIAAPCCRHLRNKGMYVPAQAADALDPASETVVHCWCNRTMTEVGDDDDLVSVPGCSVPARTCYKAP